MTSVHKQGDNLVRAYVKGASEIVLKLCKDVVCANGQRKRISASV